MVLYLHIIILYTFIVLNLLTIQISNCFYVQIEEWKDIITTFYNISIQGVPRGFGNLKWWVNGVFITSNTLK